MEPHLQRPVEPTPHRRGSVRLARLATSPVTSRVVAFAGADMLTIALGGIVTLLLARSLSTVQYGSYSFATSALAFAAMFPIPAVRQPASAWSTNSTGVGAWSRPTIREACTPVRTRRVLVGDGISR